MREVKFRGKTEYGTWVYGDVIQYESGEIAILNKFSKYGYEATEILKRTKVIPETVGEYTGLKDKNNKEIYEGDIVSCKMLSAGRTHYIDEYIATVEHDICNPCMVLKQDNGNLEYDFVKCDLMMLEVIGNIWENPELLK